MPFLELSLLIAGVLISALLYRNAVDKSKDEPVIAEEALVHAKTEHSNRYNGLYIIHFYIGARDTVVNCDVPYEIWNYLEKGRRGILCHQGGRFYSFESNGEMICQETVPPIDPVI